MTLRTHEGYSKQLAQNVVDSTGLGSPQISEEVPPFCRAHKIEADFGMAVQSATRAFPKCDKLEVFLKQDPDDEREYIAIKITTHGTVKSFLQKYDQCIADWA